MSELTGIRAGRQARDWPAHAPLRLTTEPTLTWLKVAVLAGLVFAIYWSSLWRLWSKTNPFYGEGNWGHAFMVPLIGLYYLYLNRESLARTQVAALLPSARGRRPAAIGLGVLGLAMILLPVLAAVTRQSGEIGWVKNAPTVGAMLALVGAITGVFTRGRRWSDFVACGVVAIGLLVEVAAPLVFVGPTQTLLTSAAGGMVLLGACVVAFEWGVGSLVFGLLTFGYGIWPGQNDYVKDIGLVITIFGIVLTLCGWQVMRIAWFPIAFLICALPWPGLVYSWVAGPLQSLAATVAVFVLQLLNVDAVQGGTKIVMNFGPLRPPRTLNVAEACAGLRSLMTFITIGAAIAFLSSRALWQKVLITASAVPIAILCNVMRVSGQGILDVYVSQELAEGFAHQFVGMVMLVPAFFMLLGVAWVIDRLFVEEADVAAVTSAAPPATIRRKVVLSKPVSTQAPAAE